MLVEVNDDHLGFNLSDQFHFNRLTCISFPFEFHVDLDITGLSHRNLLIVGRVQEGDGHIAVVVVMVIATGEG
jgi:hypothetical protein